MKSFSNEAKAGWLAATTGLLLVVFAWILGVKNPFQRTTHLYVTYNFAGGIEVGSPVRVSGIKVGKVESIEFFARPEPGQEVASKVPGSAQERAGQDPVVPLRLKLSIQKDAARGVRADSRFFINIAGIIGERYIEVTPGSQDAAPLKDGQVLAGVDPPRIDQLISQSFDLAGKITSLLEDNKGDITRSIDLLYKMSANLNQSRLLQSDLAGLVNNLVAITRDLRVVTDTFGTPEGKKTLALMHDLLWRLEKLDSKAIKDLLQKEGVRARVF